MTGTQNDLISSTDRQIQLLELIAERQRVSVAGIIEQPLAEVRADKVFIGTRIIQVGKA